MNLFTISDNTKMCAESLDDVLLGKTIIESAQKMIKLKKNQKIYIKNIMQMKNIMFGLENLNQIIVGHYFI